MILIGQYDSPFVRRVGIALQLYELPFEHRPWSVFGDADKLGAINPLLRVPTLVLDDGFVLTESHMMLDYLDNLVPKPQKPMFPRSQPDRNRALQDTALACGLAEKAVSLFYERRLHDVVSPVWVSRCEAQIGAVIAALEVTRASQATPFWLGQQVSHVDIAVTCALRFVTDAHPGLMGQTPCPALRDLTTRLESLPVFQEISQAFVPPA